MSLIGIFPGDYLKYQTKIYVGKKIVNILSEQQNCK